MNCVILDYDGTIVGDRIDFDSTMAQYFSRWRHHKIHIAIATGRNFRSVEKELENFNLDLDVIANNGNIIRNLKTKKMLYRREMEPSFIKEIVDILTELSIVPMFHVDGYDRGYDLAITSNADSDMNNYLKRYENRFKILSDHDILKENVLSIVFYGNRDTFENLKKMILPIHPTAEIHILTKGMSYLPIIEIIGTETNKWVGAKKYGEICNIPSKEMISIGDDVNDLLLIQNSGIGIAMKDSAEEIFSIADDVTEFGPENYGAFLAAEKYLKV